MAWLVPDCLLSAEMRDRLRSLAAVTEGCRVFLTTNRAEGIRRARQHTYGLRPHDRRSDNPRAARPHRRAKHIHIRKADRNHRDELWSWARLANKGRRE